MVIGDKWIVLEEIESDERMFDPKFVIRRFKTLKEAYQYLIKTNGTCKLVKEIDIEIIEKLSI